MQKKIFYRFVSLHLLFLFLVYEREYECKCFSSFFCILVLLFIFPHWFILIHLFISFFWLLFIMSSLWHHIITPPSLSFVLPPSPVEGLKGRLRMNSGAEQIKHGDYTLAWFHTSFSRRQLRAALTFLHLRRPWLRCTLIMQRELILSDDVTKVNLTKDFYLCFGGSRKLCCPRLFLS